MRLKNGEVLLRWPLALHVITAGFYYNDGSAHNAIDLRTNQNGSTKKPVYAAEDGTVDQTQEWDGHTTTGMQSYGTMLRLRHADYAGSTLQTRYAHLSEICVSYGQQVKEGDLIGYTGATGNVNGAHLHFEVIWAGIRRNPLVWLDSDFTTASDQVYTYGAGEHAVKIAAEIPPEDITDVTDQTGSIEIDADTGASIELTAGKLQAIVLAPLTADQAAVCDAIASRLSLGADRYATLTVDADHVAKGICVTNGDALIFYNWARSAGLRGKYNSRYVG